MMIDLTPAFRLALGCLGLALFVVGLCRMQYISRQTTLARVRWAAVGVASTGALLVLSASVRPDLLPWAAVAAPAAAVGWLMATSHAWRDSLPASMAKRKAPRIVEWRPAPPREVDTVIMGEDRRRG